MKKTVSFEEALETSNYSYINDYVSRSISELKTYMGKKDLEATEREIEKAITKFSYLVKKEIAQKNIHFIFGRYIGFIDALYEHLSKEHKEKLLKESFNSCEISEIPHVNDIIVTLHNEDGIRHGQLAHRVGIEKSTLSGIMDKLVKSGAVRYTRPGKYKYYYLSDLGKNYYISNKKVLDAGKNIDALTEQLLLYLSREEDANGKLLKIISALCSGKNAFKGYASQTKSSVNPSIIFAGIPRMKQLNILSPENTIYTVKSAYVLRFVNEESIVCLSYENNNEPVEFPRLSTTTVINEGDK